MNPEYIKEEMKKKKSFQKQMRRERVVANLPFWLLLIAFLLLIKLIYLT